MTDAAGWKADRSSLEVGLGGVGLDEEGIVIYASQVLWNSEKGKSCLSLTLAGNTWGTRQLH